MYSRSAWPAALQPWQRHHGGMSTERQQRVYDHRLIRLVQETGDATIATGLGIPRSTVAGWLKRRSRDVTTTPGLDASAGELRIRVAKLEKRVARLMAVPSAREGWTRRFEERRGGCEV